MTIQDHYQQLATSYTDYHLPRITASVDAIFPHLDLKCDDVLADIGGGTGVFSQLIWQKHILKNPVLCVDPSAEMLAVAAQHEGVNPIQASGEDFLTVDNMTKLGVTKLVFAFSLHHLVDVTATLQRISQLLVVGGKCVICFRVNPTLPFFKAAYEQFIKKEFSRKKVEMLQFCPKNPNASSTILNVPLNYNIPKYQWYQMLRNRFETHLDAISDEEIEDGIRELEETKFKDMADSDMIAIHDVCTFLVISK